MQGQILDNTICRNAYVTRQSTAASAMNIRSSENLKPSSPLTLRYAIQNSPGEYVTLYFMYALLVDRYRLPSFVKQSAYCRLKLLVVKQGRYPYKMVQIVIFVISSFYVIKTTSVPRLSGLDLLAREISK